MFHLQTNASFMLLASYEYCCENWDIEKNAFIQICPKEMLVHLPFPISDNNEKAQIRITK